MECAAKHVRDPPQHGTFRERFRLHWPYPSSDSTSSPCCAQRRDAAACAPFPGFDSRGSRYQEELRRGSGWVGYNQGESLNLHPIPLSVPVFLRTLTAVLAAPIPASIDQHSGILQVTMDHSHDHTHSHGDGHTHSHDHSHDHAHQHDHEHGHAHPAKAEFPGGDGKIYHSHDGLAPHTHEPLESPGFFSRRAQPLSRRDYKERAFTVGIGGPVGTGKTALMLALCEALRDKYSIAAVTNDIFTEEDGEFLVKHGALAPERICAVQTGGCPHAAIREDISINLGPLEELSQTFKADILLCESGGDNLAANFSRELADYIIYIIDVSGGDKIPRKGGPGITQADLLVINKTDLAEAIGADLKVMERDSLRMRDGGPFVFAQVKHKIGVSDIVNHVLKAYEATSNPHHAHS